MEEVVEQIVVEVVVRQQEGVYEEGVGSKSRLNWNVSVNITNGKIIYDEKSLTDKEKNIEVRREENAATGTVIRADK